MNRQEWKNWLKKIGLSEEEIKLATRIDVDLRVDPIVSEEQYNIATASLDTVVREAGLSDELLMAGHPLVVNGKPRMIQISGFIAHEGVNRNRNGFKAEDLKKAVEEKKLFQGPFAGIIDKNHDLMPLGYWYDSEFAFDTVSQSFGILAHGAVWAWRFPEVSDTLLAEQTRNGSVALSMAALTRDREITTGPDGKSIEWLHNPVFVAATLVIDAEPADPNSRGIVEETPLVSSEEARKKTLTNASLGSEQTINGEDDIMDINEIKSALTDVLGTGADQVLSKISDVLDQKIAEFKTESAEKDTAVAEANTKVSELTAKIAELEGSVNEKALAFETLKGEKEGIETRVAELETELKAFNDAKEVGEKEALKGARYNELSQAVRAVLDQKSPEQKSAMLDRWATLTEAEWNERKEELNLSGNGTPKKEGILGGLPNVAPGAGKHSDISRFLR